MTQQIWQQVTGDTKLVSLPAAYLKLKTLLDSADFEMQEVADIIRNDPAMTARLLQLVNSAFFGYSARIETVSRAITLLGTQQVHDLMLATSVVNTFNGISADIMDMTTFWRRSVYCGVVSRLLANSCSVLDSERLFVAGLLRDIGHLAMYQSIPQLAAEAFRNAGISGQPLYQVERELIGFEYAKVSGFLIDQWGLPQSLREAAELHVEPTRSEAFPMTTHLVHIAAQITDAGMGNGSWETALLNVDPLTWGETGLTPEQCVEVRGLADQHYKEVESLILHRQQSA